MGLGGGRRNPEGRERRGGEGKEKGPAEGKGKEGPRGKEQKGTKDKRLMRTNYLKKKTKSKGYRKSRKALVKSIPPNARTSV